MIKPGLSDEQLELVINSLAGDTLVQLLRSSIQNQDMCVLLALEKYGALESALLTQAHTQAEESLLRHCVLDHRLTPMLDALGEFMVDPKNLIRELHSNRTEFHLEERFSQWLGRQIERNLSHLHGAISEGHIVQPGHHGEEEKVRLHLSGLGALSVACDRPDLIDRIQRMDPQALFELLHSDTIKSMLPFHSYSAWGFAFQLRSNRCIMQAHPAGQIAKPVALNVYDGGENSEDVLPEQLIRHIDPDCEADKKLAIWALSASCQIQIQGDAQKHPGHAFLERMCKKNDAWHGIAPEVLKGAPQFFRMHQRSCLEKMAKTENWELLRVVLRDHIDWNNEGINDPLTGPDGPRLYGLRALPLDHPLAVIVDANGGVHQTSRCRMIMDESVFLVLEALHEKGHLQDFLSAEISMNDDTLNLAQELVYKDLANSLDYLLRHGLNANLLDLDGVTLLKFSEDQCPDNNSTSILRAHAAAQAMNKVMGLAPATDPLRFPGLGS